MSLVRRLVDQKEIEFHPKETFHAQCLPTRFLEFESDKQRIWSSWKDFVRVANTISKSYRQRGLAVALMALTNKKQHKLYKEQVFQTGMENVCHEFSRKTESLKLSFEVREKIIYYENKKKKRTFWLKFKKYNAMPDECRNVPFWVAEIPSSAEATAEFVAYRGQEQVEETEARERERDRGERRCNSASRESTQAQAQVLWTLPSVQQQNQQHLQQQQEQQQQQIMSLSSEGQYCDSQDQDDEQNQGHPPMAVAVAVAESTSTSTPVVAELETTIPLSCTNDVVCVLPSQEGYPPPMALAVPISYYDEEE